ncbi:jg20358 [Pararge aegeria aegeria]|uniref:Jg20358 protein n=1 Tax=Pararge aegeria aegeria TaxID=348720 RepID=A0A8S4RAS4_9NEOP|nr:jg20358 [Pararge aegeria aegeria]
MTYVYNIVFLFVYAYVSTVNSQLQTENGKINIMVGTTSGCRDAANFMPQIRSTYNRFKDFVNFEFVPWGKTTRREDGTLNCQFGPRDCWANRVHRCALHMLKGNADAQMKYIECEFSYPQPAYRQGSIVCAYAAGLNVVEMDICIRTGVGDELEIPAEEITREPMGIIQFVPLIVFNNNTNLALHVQGYNRLESVICFALADDETTGITHCRV